MPANSRWDLIRVLKGLNEWKGRARNREAWRHIVEEAKAHPGAVAPSRNVGKM